MKWQEFVGVTLVTGLSTLAILPARAAEITQTQTSGEQITSKPMMLDLSPFFWERFVTSERTNTEMVSVSGRQIFDGLPFQVDGRACLFGKAHSRRSTLPPNEMMGIKVGRTFDELHLLHATQFTDREQEVVAKVRLNYADGTRSEFPLAYGVHVRDWQRMNSEEREIYTDPETKVIWRGPGVAMYKSQTRMSKTRLLNPFPRKVVRTIDFVSARNIAWYDIAAATVANSDASRPVTPAVPLDKTQQTFDASLTVRVVDAADRPIEGVIVEPNISAGGSPAATVSTPFYTDKNGTGRVKYPRSDCSALYFDTTKEGWKRALEDPWVRVGRMRDRGETNEIIVTIRMLPDPSKVAGRGIDDRTTSPNTIAAGTARSPIETGIAATAEATRAKTASELASIPAFQPHPVLIIPFPAGSKVRVEASEDLGAKVWDSVVTFTNLPASPYPFICGSDCPTQSKRFYRAVLLP